MHYVRIINMVYYNILKSYIQNITVLINLLFSSHQLITLSFYFECKIAKSYRVKIPFKNFTHFYVYSNLVIYLYDAVIINDTHEPLVYLNKLHIGVESHKIVNYHKSGV